MEPLEDGDPRQVGRFEIVARLGSGGMGRVYLARSASGDQFALKMIHLFHSDDVQFRRRFQREVMAARKVKGENTAALVDADPDARPPWMAVEYVDGPTLTELVEQGGPLTLGSSVRLAAGMAQALISIHAAGLVHRDLKPSNVLMSSGGARLIDFGIAQASGASSLTMTGLVTGSAGFMSPEQAQAEKVTEASDVFALGTVLYFAATGQRPFGEGSIISVTYRVVHAEPDLAAVRDEGLRELIANCLMKDPLQRPTPEEILARCPRLLDGSWRVGQSGYTTSTLAVAQGTGTTAQQPSLLGGPAPVRSRRESLDTDGRGRAVRGPDARRPDRVSAFAAKPWLVVPVAAAAVLAVGTAIALTLAAGNPDSPDPGTGTSTQQPNDAAGPTDPSLELPDGSDRVGPSIYESRTKDVDVPRATATSTRPTTRPTASKSATPKPTVTDPETEPDEPVVTTTTEPPVEPTDDPVEPTDDPVEPTSTEPAGAGGAGEPGGAGD